MNGSENGEIWALLLDEKVVGHLSMCEVDQPWFNCKFAPTPEFSQYAPLFHEEQRLINADLVDEWIAYYARIEVLKPTLIGFYAKINELLIHIEGDRAWFRYI